MEHIYQLWNFLDLVVAIVGWMVVATTILVAIGTFFAFVRGVAKPLWRLGLGLARKRIVIVAGPVEANSLSNLVKESNIFSAKRITMVSSREDSEDIKKNDVVLFRYSGSPFTLKEVLEKKEHNVPVVVYAKPREIQNDDDWELLDEYRNVSVCNLKGRLLNDLLTLMMTTRL